jgi:hypothetical protein
MYSPEVTIVVAGVAALGLGLGIGFKLGKLHGMQLAADAYDLAKSFGVGQKGVQAGTQSQGASISPGATPYGLGGGVGRGVATGNPNQLQDLYNLCFKAGMSPTDAIKILGTQIQRQTAHQQELMQKKMEIEYKMAQAMQAKGGGV